MKLISLHSQYFLFIFFVGRQIAIFGLYQYHYFLRALNLDSAARQPALRSPSLPSEDQGCRWAMLPSWLFKRVLGTQTELVLTFIHKVLDPKSHFSIPSLEKKKLLMILLYHTVRSGLLPSPFTDEEPEVQRG